MDGKVMYDIRSQSGRIDKLFRFRVYGSETPRKQMDSMLFRFLIWKNDLQNV